MENDKSKLYSSFSKAPYKLVLLYKKLGDYDEVKAMGEKAIKYYEELISIAKENNEFVGIVENIKELMKF
ncbi:hypothetical protein [Clostridium acetobutylicum]|nr:hypothetical protein [Clostridium acetobutylicum]NRY57935.1 tetratricopeptide (TPR) repeat protein [Clostridium acetobutylicum]OOL98159.1 hypothetical protein CLACE_21020 [Clostridium acetobutylicum]OOM06060.1 hypothetical protein CLABU_18690 [Clostridium acetobutylicum]